MAGSTSALASTFTYGVPFEMGGSVSSGDCGTSSPNFPCNFSESISGVAFVDQDGNPVNLIMVPGPNVAVPEPNSGWLLLSGLALIGLHVRNRQSNRFANVI